MIVLRGDKDDLAHGLRGEIRQLQAKLVQLKREWDGERHATHTDLELARNQAEVLERALESSKVSDPRADWDRYLAGKFSAEPPLRPPAPGSARGQGAR